MYSFDALFHRYPACENAEGHEESRQHHEQDGDTVHAHVVADAATHPVDLFDHLEAGVRIIEPCPDDERQDEDEYRRHQRDIADIATRSLAVVLDQKDQ